MNKIFSLNSLFLLLVLLVGIVIGRNAKSPQHKCIDTTHQICDGQCPCDGMECGSIPTNVVPLRDYQMELTQDSVTTNARMLKEANQQSFDKHLRR